EASGAMDPRELTAGVLRLLGLPQSEELPDPPSGCSWPAPPDVVASYGPRELSSVLPRSGDAYLKNLRSLGYL
ncbi:MAG: hypothetical protein KDD47_28215, partial [Acidobacteria bacterium]|nr:hypothetical protein [Acidobacteriota bacterium]